MDNKTQEDNNQWSSARRREKAESKISFQLVKPSFVQTDRTSSASIHQRPWWSISALTKIKLLFAGFGLSWWLFVLINWLVFTSMLIKEEKGVVCPFQRGARSLWILYSPPLYYLAPLLLSVLKGKEGKITQLIGHKHLVEGLKFCSL